MKRHSRTFAVVLLFGLSRLAFAQGATSPVTARLVVPDQRTLPGMPFDMWVELRNGSDSAVGVGLCATLLVRPDVGDSFEAKRPTNRFPTLLSAPGASNRPVEYLVLTPGQMQTLTLPIRDYLVGAEFFGDHRLSPPGKYRIALRLDFCWHDAVPRDHSPVLPVTFLGPVLTNEVSMERIDPTGSDAKVWGHLQELAKGQWSQDCLRTTWASDTNPDCGSPVGSDVWHEIITKYPDSNYVPYALLADPGIDDQYLDRVLEAIKQFPDSPVSELLHLKASGIGVVTRRPAIYNVERAIVAASRRPTTRIRAFGREDVAKGPCRPDVVCEQ